MAQFKAIIINNEHYENSEGKYNIKIRLTHRGVAKYISTDYYLLPNQIDDSTGQVQNHPNATLINVEVQGQIIQYQKQVIEEGQKIDYKTCQQVRDLLLLKPEGDLDFYKHAEGIIDRFYKSKRTGIAESYAYAVKHLKDFNVYCTLPFKQITTKYLRDFEEWLSRDKSVNTIGIYLRSIRAIYNRAVDDELISIANYPFRKFKIKKEETIKRNLSIENIIYIRDKDRALSMNILNTLSDIQLQIELLAKAFIQQYKDRMIGNKLTTSE